MVAWAGGWYDESHQRNEPDIVGGSNVLCCGATTRQDIDMEWEAARVKQPWHACFRVWLQIKHLRHAASNPCAAQRDGKPVARPLGSVSFDTGKILAAKDQHQLAEGEGHSSRWGCKQAWWDSRL